MFFNAMPQKNISIQKENLAFWKKETAHGKSLKKSILEEKWGENPQLNGELSKGDQLWTSRGRYTQKRICQRHKA